MELKKCEYIKLDEEDKTLLPCDFCNLYKDLETNHCINCKRLNNFNEKEAEHD